MNETSVLRKKEIESHSTMITNERIGAIKNAVWHKGLDVMSSKPDPISVNEFFSAICQWWLETPLLFETDVNKEIGDHLKESIKIGNRLAMKHRIYGNLNIIETEQLLQLSLMMQYMMNIGMQNLGYYFKVSTPEPKGFDDALKIFGMDAVKEFKEELKENAAN